MLTGSTLEATDETCPFDETSTDEEEMQQRTVGKSSPRLVSQFVYFRRKTASTEILAEVSVCRSREGQARHRWKICVVMQEQTVASWHMPVKDCARSSAAFVILANIQKSITCCYMYT